MLPFLWKHQRSDLISGAVGDFIVHCSPMKGLSLTAGRLHIPRVLAVEIVDAQGLGPQSLATTNTPPEVVNRQDIVMVQYAATVKRPVECQARWRVLPEGILDLEVSTLTPGKWDGLAVQTCSTFQTAENPSEEVCLEETVNPGIVLYRPQGYEISYVEFCHPYDGIGLKKSVENGVTSIRYRLFGHDLEKGVILRGRLRGLIVPRAVDAAAAHAAYQRFIKETPNLT